MISPRLDDTPYRGNFIWYIAGLAVAIVLLVVATLMASSGRPTGWEYTWFMAINGWPERLYRTMSIIAFFGTLWAAVASVVVAFIGRFYRLTWRLALSIGLAYGAALGLKELVGRMRPADVLSGVHVRFAEVGLGYPSCKVLIITVIALSLVPYLKRRWQWLPLLVIACTAVTPLYMGTALPLDIAGGFAIGVLVVACIRLLPQSLRVLLRID